MTLEEKMINSLLARYQAQKQEAAAMIELYIKKAVGVGEHSQILDEIDKWVALATEADDKHETLLSMINVEIVDEP